VRLRERLITLSLARQAIVKQSAERGANTVAMGIHRPAVDCNAINERGVLHAKLVREGFRGNVKVVERLYREERLTLRRRNRKKIPKGVLEGAWCPIAAIQRWSLDFTMDALAPSRACKHALPGIERTEIPHREPECSAPLPIAHAAE